MLHIRIYTMMIYTTTLLGNDNECIIGLLRGGCLRGGGNWGTLRIPREDWGTLGNIREY